MKPERQARIAELFDEAVSSAPEARDRFVERISSDDPPLGEEIRSLLSASYAADEYFERVAEEAIGPALAEIAAAGDDLAPDELRARLESALDATYRIERELGGGGMSRVFLATELRLQRKVVIKILPEEMALGVSFERFRREIQLSARLQHSHIVPVLATDVADGVLYYTMPYVAGETLRSRIAREGALPLADAIAIWRDMLDALAYAHSSGVIHRDIKPENVFLGSRNALVADFGIARAIEAAADEVNVTATGVTLGTPAYMAPEQAAGESGVDHRIDIYAAGLVMYEMLAGRAPFAGLGARQVLVAHITQQPPPLTRADLPAALSALVLRCLAKDPAARPPTADSILHEVDRAVAVGAGSGIPNWTILAATAAAAFFLVSTVAIGHFMSRQNAPAAEGLRPPEGRHDVPARAPPDTAAKRLVAEAQEFARQRDNKSCETAIKFYSQATDKDPNYAEAWGGLAKTRALCALWGPGDPNVEFAAAKSASETALRLDATLSGAYTARGMVHLFHEQDWSGAQRDFTMASRLDSTQFEPWLFRNHAYLAENNVDSAVESMRHAKELAPVEPIVGVRLATALRYQGHTDQAQAALAEILERDPNNLIAHRERFEIEVATMPCDSAARDIRWVEHDDHPQIRGIVEFHWASCGNAGRARRYADSVAAQASAGSYVDYFWLATVYAGLGDSANVFRSLSKAVTQHNSFLFLLRHHFAFRKYLGVPEIREVMRRAHLK
ncbi:MAG TPA: protein kinase [Gemmatimonadaceae bacterium]